MNVLMRLCGVALFMIALSPAPTLLPQWLAMIYKALAAGAAVVNIAGSLPRERSHAD